MEDILYFLHVLRKDIYKLLPMREAEDRGEEVYLAAYLEKVLTTVKGGLVAYPELREKKQYLYVATWIGYLFAEETVEFSKWKKIVLNSGRALNTLRSELLGGKYGERD